MQLVTATGTATHPRAFLTPPSSHQPTLSQASSAHLRLHHFLFSLQLSLSARPASAFFPSTSSSFPSSSSSSCSSKMSSDSHPSTSPPADYHVPPPKFDKDISNTLTSQEAHESARTALPSSPPTRALSVSPVCCTHSCRRRLRCCCLCCSLAGTCPEWSANIKCVLFDSAEIRSKVQELAVAISRHYAGRSVLCVGLLTGAFVFLADVVRHLTIPYQVDFMVVSSYGQSAAQQSTATAQMTASSAAALTPPSLPLLRGFCFSCSQRHHLRRLRAAEEGHEHRYSLASVLLPCPGLRVNDCSG